MTQRIKSMITACWGSALVTLVCTQAAYADDLPDILEYQPNCVPAVIEQVKVNDISAGYIRNQVPQETPAFAQTLQTLRQNAAQAGADAIILSRVHHLILSQHQQESGLRLNTQLEADFIRFCADDTSLSNNRTQYDLNGYRIKQTRMQYTLTMPEDKSAKKLAASMQLPPAVISLEQGVYGAHLGMSQQKVLELLGPPSIELNLRTEQIAWGYGRHMWFIFDENRLYQVASSDLFLNGFGRNLIDHRDGFDTEYWLINGVIAQKSTLEHTKLQLKEQLTALSQTEYQLTNSHAELRLGFETFQPHSRTDTVQLLSYFKLTPSKFTAEKLRVTQPEKAELTALVSRLAPYKMAVLPTLSQLQTLCPTMHRLNISPSGTWWLAGNHVQLQFSDQELKKIHLTQQIFNDPSQPSQINHLLSLLDIPRQKDQLLTQFPDASDNFDMVDIYHDNFVLEARYTSEQGDAQVQELQIEYF